jgi:hypothetical protein
MRWYGAAIKYLQSPQSDTDQLIYLAWFEAEIKYIDPPEWDAVHWYEYSIPDPYLGEMGRRLSQELELARSQFPPGHGFCLSCALRKVIERLFDTWFPIDTSGGPL